jgi:CoA:oxalate CoA-transferase
VTSPTSASAPIPTPLPSSTAEPLAGFRILDLTIFLSGPLATRSLATLGATVVKVEPPSGDPTRAGWGWRDDEPPSPYWLNLHRDRQAVVLDLKEPAGRAVFLELVERADAVVDNYRPGVMGRLDLGPDVLRERNPRLVSCSITGFGSEGPVAQMAAIDGPVQAFAGVLDLTGGPDGPGPPVPLQIADLAAGVYATQAVLAALLARERTGRGSHIDLSMLECLLQWLGVVDRIGTLAPPATLVVETADGRHLLVQAIMHFHPRLAELIDTIPGCEGFAADERFADRFSRAAHRDDYETTVRRAFRARTGAEWLTDLHAAGVPAAQVHLGDDVLAHPQLADRGAMIDAEVPGQGPTRVVGPPFVFDGQRRTTTTPPPRLGEHTHAVLAAWLGYGQPELEAAAAAGAFGSPAGTA